MRCPACTTTVDDFKTLRLDVDPTVVQAVIGGRTPALKAKDVREVAGVQGEDDGKPVLLRFDNASWVGPSSIPSLSQAVDEAKDEGANSLDAASVATLI